MFWIQKTTWESLTVYAYYCVTGRLIDAMEDGRESLANYCIASSLLRRVPMPFLSEKVAGPSQLFEVPEVNNHGPARVSDGNVFTRTAQS